MSVTVDMAGNDLVVKSISVGADKIGDTTTTPWSLAAVENPGTDALVPNAFDKVTKVSIGGVDYWIGLYDNNTTA